MARTETDKSEKQSEEEEEKGGARRGAEEEAKNRRSRKKAADERSQRGPEKTGLTDGCCVDGLCGTTLYLKEQQTGRQRDRDLENCRNSPMKHAQVISSSTAHC